MGVLSQPFEPLEKLTLLLGDIILTKEGEKRTKDVLANKDYVMLFFCARWSPHCLDDRYRQLTEAYTKSGKKDKVALVFVSADKDAHGCKEYYGEIPFFALPFSPLH